MTVKDLIDRVSRDLIDPNNTRWKRPELTDYLNEGIAAIVLRRPDLSRTTKRAYDGRSVGLYRERDELIPIILRHVTEDIARVDNFEFLQIQSPLSTEPVPLAQVVRGVGIFARPPVLWRICRTWIPRRHGVGSAGFG